MNEFGNRSVVWPLDMARSSQEQQHIAAALAARDNSALYQIYQRYAHDPSLLQRQLSAYLASKNHDGEMAARMTDASHLVYHFASESSPLTCYAFTGCPPKRKTCSVFTGWPPKSKISSLACYTGWLPK